MKVRQTLRERLSNQRALLGFLQTYPNPALTEMAGRCGYDFLFFDGEHGLFGEMDFFQALQTTAATDAIALIRLGKHDPHALGRYLDIGADGIVVPNVSTAEQARLLVRGFTYPPAGTRGFGASLHRTTNYGLDLDSHLNAPRQGACLLPIVESFVGVDNVEEILATEGVDGVIIGIWDLTADLGRAGDFSQPAFAQATARIERAAVANGKILGTAPHPGNPIEALISRGHRLLLIDDDVSLVCETMSAKVAKARSCFR